MLQSLHPTSSRNPWGRPSQFRAAGYNIVHFGVAVRADTKGNEIQNNNRTISLYYYLKIIKIFNKILKIILSYVRIISSLFL